MTASIDTYRNSKFVTVACPLCGGQEHRHERTIRGFSLVRCRDCDLVFVNPQLDAAEVARIYEDKKDPNEVIEIYTRLATPGVIGEYDRKLEQIETLRGSKGRILDFACAAAYFVERAAARGWDAHGVDIGSWVGLAAERRGIRNVHIGQLSELSFPESYFDVIYAAQVFEHLQAPVAILAELRRILRPDGLLYVDVPNYRTIPIMLGRDDFFLNSPPQHINFFTPRTLELLLKSGGFHIEFLSTEGGLKWENLIGRPIASDIADAYRARTADNRSVPRTYRWSAAASLKSVLRPLVAGLFYRSAKVGINLVAISRPGGSSVPAPM